jgi:hypothetical protein
MGAPQRDWGNPIPAARCYNGPVSSLMLFPRRMPGLRTLTALGGIYALVWISLEGSLPGVIILAVTATFLGLAHGSTRLLGGRAMGPFTWIGAFVFGGMALGLGAAMLTLLFMAVKTGLHGHGPEFTQEEVIWVARQTPLWTAAGFLAGLGLGLLLYRPGAPGQQG